MSDEPLPPLAPMLELVALGDHGPLSLRLDTRLRLPRRLDLPFDEGLVGEGWHGCESNEGRPFRWMGMAPNATVELPVDRSVDLAADIEVFLLIDAGFADQLHVTLDASTEPCPHDWNGGSLSFVIPRAPLHDGTTLVTLFAPGLVQLPDTRRLSMACSRLRIRPIDDGLDEDARLVLKRALSDRLSPTDLNAAGFGRFSADTSGVG